MHECQKAGGTFPVEDWQDGLQDPEALSLRQISAGFTSRTCLGIQAGVKIYYSLDARFL